MDDWKAWAVPWKAVAMWAGRTSPAAACTCDTASPRAVPGRRLKESVTEGICPEWVTVSGPRLLLRSATAFSGTRRPEEDLTYRSERAAGSRRYSGLSSRITWYWLLGA